MYKISINLLVLIIVSANSITPSEERKKNLPKNILPTSASVEILHVPVDKNDYTQTKTTTPLYSFIKTSFPTDDRIYVQVYMEALHGCQIVIYSKDGTEINRIFSENHDPITRPL